MIDYSGYRLLATDWIVLAFARVWLWFTHSTAIVCRDCGAEILPEALVMWTQTGCTACGGVNLATVRDAE
jgi:hypothetical protein